jgi:hypothetical protein
MPVRDVDDVHRTLGNMHPGAEPTLVIVRHGLIAKLHPTLTSWPLVPSSQRDASP